MPLGTLHRLRWGTRATKGTWQRVAWHSLLHCWAQPSWAPSSATWCALVARPQTALVASVSNSCSSLGSPWHDNQTHLVRYAPCGCSEQGTTFCAEPGASHCLQVWLALQHEVPPAQLPQLAHQQLQAGMAAGLGAIHSAAAAGQVCITPTITDASRIPCLSSVRFARAVFTLMSLLRSLLLKQACQV